MSDSGVNRGSLQPLQRSFSTGSSMCRGLWGPRSHAAEKAVSFAPLGPHQGPNFLAHATPVAMVAGLFSPLPPTRRNVLILFRPGLSPGPCDGKISFCLAFHHHQTHPLSEPGPDLHGRAASKIDSMWTPPVTILASLLSSPLVFFILMKSEKAEI